MENAVRHLTDVPARLFGFTERGRIAEGWHADIVVFDPETVGATDVELVFDLPGDSKRLWSEANISRVLVNGVVSVADGTATGAIAGKVMRAGVDTEDGGASPAAPRRLGPAAGQDQASITSSVGDRCEQRDRVLHHRLAVLDRHAHHGIVRHDDLIAEINRGEHEPENPILIELPTATPCGFRSCAEVDRARSQRRA